jgi:hypothetical protein
MAAQGETQSRGDALERLAQVGTYRTLGEQVLFDVVGAILIVIGIPIMVSALGIGP